jgi:hypothetical protein
VPADSPFRANTVAVPADSHVVLQTPSFVVSTHTWYPVALFAAPHDSVNAFPRPVAPLAGETFPNAVGGCGEPLTVNDHHAPLFASVAPLVVWARTCQ